MTEQEGESRLPPGYHLDKSDPDVWALRRPAGWAVTHAPSAAKEAPATDPPNASPFAVRTFASASF
jgi:hypothetical protein